MKLISREKIIKKTSTGFTLVETLVTIGIFVILMLGITILFKNIYVTSNQQSLSLETTDQARLELFNFTNEIRNATNGNDGSYPIIQADNAQVVFFSSFGATDNNINRIRYYVVNSTLYKGTTIPTGSPKTYNLSTETVLPVVTNIAATTSSIFYYYDGNYDGTSTPLTQPVNVNQIKFVKMNLTITKQDARNSTSTFSVIAGGAIRNLKTNLGN